MTIGYIDANKNPLVQGKAYVLEDTFYLLDQPIPSEPNQPLRAISDSGMREEIMSSAFAHMFELDNYQMRTHLNVLRRKVNFLEKQLAQVPTKCLACRDEPEGKCIRDKLLESGVYPC